MGVNRSSWVTPNARMDKAASERRSATMRPTVSGIERSAQGSGTSTPSMVEWPAVCWAWGRLWRRGGAANLAALGAVATLLLAGTLGAAAWQARLALRVQQEASAASTAAADTPWMPPAPVFAAPEFTAGLSATPSTPAAMAVVQDAAERAGVSIDSVQVQASAPTGERLGHSDLSITVRGPYAALKRWLADVTGRVPAGTVLQLQIERTAAATDLEARVTLRVWARAAAEAADR
jgi:hypothetical protein